jgi:hypothetical protein
VEPVEAALLKLILHDGRFMEGLGPLLWNESDQKLGETT